MDQMLDTYNYAKFLDLPLKRFKYLNETNTKIDLENFESPEFQTSKYVLTSPRSLEACSRLKIKPTELVEKGMFEVEAELNKNKLQYVSSDKEPLPLWLIEQVYLKEEAERQKRLAMARLERSKIINNQVYMAKSLSSSQSLKDNHFLLYNSPDLKSNSLKLAATTTSQPPYPEELDIDRAIRNAQLVASQDQELDLIENKLLALKIEEANRLSPSLNNKMMLTELAYKQFSNQLDANGGPANTNFLSTFDRASELRNTLNLYDQTNINSFKDQVIKSRMNAGIKPNFITSKTRSKRGMSPTKLNPSDYVSVKSRTSQLNNSLVNLGNISAIRPTMAQTLAKSNEELRAAAADLMRQEPNRLTMSATNPKLGLTRSSTLGSSGSLRRARSSNELNRDGQISQQIKNFYLQKKIQNIRKTNETESRLNKALMNSKKINQEVNRYRQNKLQKSIEQMDRAIRNREQNLIDRSTRLYSNTNEKMKTANLNNLKKEEDRLIKNLELINKIKRKEEYLSPALADSVDLSKV